MRRTRSTKLRLSRETVGRLDPDRLARVRAGMMADEPTCRCSYAACTTGPPLSDIISCATCEVPACGGPCIPATP